MSHTQILISYIISNLVAVTFLLISLNRKQLARVLFAALFLWAAWENWSMSHKNPDVYLYFSRYAVGMYRDFILDPFAGHITAIVSFIAICQFFIGVGLLSGGAFYRVSCLCGMLFLVAISPLGIASAFPSGLIWSLGLFVLYNYPFEGNIFYNKWRSVSH